MLWVILHVGWSLAASVVFACTRRGAVLVFTHYHDLDATGRDRQMGPLIDALRQRGERFFEVTRVPVDATLLQNWRMKRRLFVSQGALVALGRLVGRVRVARWWLGLLRPRVLVLIDESGSGQALLRAARQLGIRVVGVQHGDFKPGDPRYDLGDNPRGIEPADVLCVWSAWFRRRLLQLSPLYDDSNTQVTGRLRYEVPAHCPPDHLTVLVVSEPGPAFAGAIAPYLAALHEAPGVTVRVQHHPADPRRPADQTDLLTALAECHVAVGRGSSALLEARFAGRPVVVCAAPGMADPAGLVADGVAVGCDDPGRLAALCAGLASEDRTVAACPVWHPAPADTAVEILRVALQDNA